VSFKAPMETSTEKLLQARNRAEKEFEVVASYLWPVDPLLEGLAPVELDAEQQAALDEAEREREAETTPEFKPIVVLRDPQVEDERRCP
jgi:hypothetical protein